MLLVHCTGHHQKGQNSPGKGRFFLFFGANRQVLCGRSDRGPMVVLVVDDDDGLRNALSSALTRFKGIKIIQARNGKEALEVLRSETVGLVVSDVQMPEMDGAELVCEIQKMSTNKPAVLIMSGWSPYSDAELFKMGALAFFDKTSQMKQLVQTIRNFTQDAA